MNIGAKPHKPAVRRHFAQKHFKQCGFAHAVGTDDGNGFPTLDIQIHMAENTLSAVGLGQFFRMEYVTAADDAGCQCQAHMGRQAVRAIDTLDFFQLFFPAFCTLDGFFPIECLQCADDFFLTFQFPLLVFVCLLLDIPVDGFLVHVCGVVAVVYSGFSVFDFHYLGDDFIQEITVMGNDEDRAVVCFQEIFQPFNGSNVQMVGRFVQQQQIRLG